MTTSANIEQPVNCARGRRITLAMSAKGMSYNCHLSYDLGVTEATLSRWRKGAIMSIENAINLAEKLDISLDWLLLGCEPSSGDGSYQANTEIGQMLTEYNLLSDEDKELVSFFIMKKLGSGSVPSPTAA